MWSLIHAVKVPHLLLLLISPIRHLVVCCYAHCKSYPCPRDCIPFPLCPVCSATRTRGAHACDALAMAWCAAQAAATASRAVPAGTCPDCGAAFVAGVTAAQGHRGSTVAGTAAQFGAWLSGHRGRGPCLRRQAAAPAAAVAGVGPLPVPVGAPPPG